jgi:hypothetical protein
MSHNDDFSQYTRNKSNEQPQLIERGLFCPDAVRDGKAPVKLQRRHMTYTYVGAK